jgi:membrane protein
VVAILVFLGGSVALRAYISFILDHNHAYGTLAAPIAALLFFFVLALGVLYGAEVNATIEQMYPAPIRQPRVLSSRRWRRLDERAHPTAPQGKSRGHATELAGGVAGQSDSTVS